MVLEVMITVGRCFAAARLRLSGLSGRPVRGRMGLRRRLSGARLHQAAIHDGDVRLSGALRPGPARLAHARVRVRAVPVAGTVERHVVRRALGPVQVRVDARARLVYADLSGKF